MSNNKIALRIDDIGASSKIHEIYSKRWKGLGNILFLKYLRGIGAWGPYRELAPNEWEKIFALLERHHAKLTVAITASWVGPDGSLIPFNQKFPEQAKLLVHAEKAGIVRIACHGLTHCVLENKKFLPRLFTSNRQYHREFWDWLPYEVHDEHLKRAQEILTTIFQKNIDLLIPPGNVFCQHTLKAAQANGIKYINCQTESKKFEQITILSNHNVIPFHDREIVLYGLAWLEELLVRNVGKQFCFVEELR